MVRTPVAKTVQNNKLKFNDPVYIQDEEECLVEQKIRVD